MKVFKKDSNSSLFLNVPTYIHKDNPRSSFLDSDECMKTPVISTPSRKSEYCKKNHVFKTHEFNKRRKIYGNLIEDYYQDSCSDVVKSYWIKNVLRLTFLFIMTLILFLIFVILPPFYVLENEMFKNTSRNIFYLIDIQHFQDSDKDGIGDIKGITRNIALIRKLDITHIILTNSPHVRSENNSTIPHLDELVRMAHIFNIKVLWDITPNAITNSVKEFIKYVDGYYFSSTRYEAATGYYMTEQLTHSIHKTIYDLKLIWYVEIFIPDYEKMEEARTNIYWHSTVQGVIFTFDIETNFMRRANIADKWFWYIFCVQQIHKKDNKFRFRERIYSMDSPERDDSGVHHYVHFWAMMAYSRFPIMLKAGQEFAEGIHETKNYAERIAKLKKENKPSYLYYLDAVNQAANDKRLIESTESSSFGSMNDTFIWIRRRVPHTDQMLYGFALVENHGDEELIEMRSKMAMILDHSKPLEKKGDGKITQMTFYIGVMKDGDV